MTVTIIDCYDSFTYNLYQLVGSLGEKVVAITCDESVGAVKATEPDCIILSPGPGTPSDSGVCKEVIRAFAGKVPILGVCLGHQTIIESYGGAIVRMERPVHGETSTIHHSGTDVFAGISDHFTATRYHSLMADPESLPKAFEITAQADDDHCIMAVAHRALPIYGVQFHPESIMTACGRQMLCNFLKMEAPV